MNANMVILTFLLLASVYGERFLTGRDSTTSTTQTRLPSTASLTTTPFFTAHSVPCTPRDFATTGHCITTDQLDDKCSNQEISASPDCIGSDSWCCYDVPKRNEHVIQNTTLFTPNTCVSTPSDDLGPYYANGAPVVSMMGNQTVMFCNNSYQDDRILLSGTIRFRQPGYPCGMPGRAMIELWQSDVTGLYSVIPKASQNPFPVLFEDAGPFTLVTNATGVDDPNWNCRLKIITGDDGYYSLSSVIPGRYRVFAGWRPAHIHARVTPLDSYNRPLNDTFTTQLYFYHDMFNNPHDPCPVCQSGNPGVTIFYTHDDDFKTFIGRQDFLI